jgi:hypothetical protein
MDSRPNLFGEHWILECEKDFRASRRDGWGGRFDLEDSTLKRGAIMTTVMPEGEAIRRAIKWISAEVSEHPDTPPSKYVNEAILKFDLSPADADFLIRFYKSEQARRTEDD